MSWYQIKGALLSPWIAMQRWRFRDATRLDKAILEANRYSLAFARFARANPGNKLLVGDLALPDNALVLDVGGYDGDWTAAVRERFDAHVYVYEPMPTAIANLEKRFASDNSVTICPVGLASADGTETLSLLGPGSSVIRSDSRPATRQAEVQLRDVGSAMAELPARDIDLLKINIEGAEYDVLDRLLQLNLQKRCQALMIQYHEFVPRAHRRRMAINRQLAATHKCVWNYKFIWERWERIS